MGYSFVKLDNSMIKTAAEIETTALDSWNEAQLLSELESEAGYLFAALYNGELCGLCALQCAAGEGSLNTITLLPNHRGVGIGKALLQFAIESCPALIFYLEVRSKNSAAIGLYKSLGFNTAGTRKGFYKNPDDDALIMKLILTHGE